METFETYCKKYLTGNGMFDDDAETVFNLFMHDETQTTMVGRWNDDMETYPPMMQNVCIVALNHFTVKWIETNLPFAWFKGMFEKFEKDEKLLNVICTLL